MHPFKILSLFILSHMRKKKVLFVTQDLSPYTETPFIADLAKLIPQLAYNEGYDLRVLMPKFGVINERRHRLHEVVRLSGMNIIVNDEDYPLIIKVASLPGTRLQVYFLDNDEFFKRKAMLTDEEDHHFEDNQERMVFFCKGAIETVKKFGWAPDIVHVVGQMTSLIPYYIREAYKNEPIFWNSKIIYSAYNFDIESSFNENFSSVAAINELTEKEVSDYFLQSDKVDLNERILKYTHVYMAGSEHANNFVSEYGSDNNLMVMPFNDDVEGFAKEMLKVYESLTQDLEE